MRVLAAIVAGVASVLAMVCTGPVQAAPWNAEACTETTWGYLKTQGYEYGAVNTRPFPVAVKFKTRTGPVLEFNLRPGEGFRTGLTIEAFEAERKSSGWIAIVCPAGTVPSLAMSEANWSAILRGEYECRKP